MGGVVRQKTNEALMAAGVTLIDPATTYVEPDVQVGPDTVIHPGVTLEGRTRIGSACEIRSHVRIRDSVIGDRVTINDCCVLTGATVGTGASVGPFAHLRPDSVMGEASRVGNFVELKKTTLGPGSKANHLTYLGDATIGEQVNVGAGTITCNYDGTQKHPTVIEDGAFIGSDTQLIAPVRIGRGAYVGAGSSITEDVPARSAGHRARPSGQRRRLGRTAEEGAVERIAIMCGIIGYIGSKPVVPVLLDGLRRMEYRGYDSAGVALVSPEGIALRRSAGKLANLES